VKDTQNTTIVLLLVTAAVLTAMIIPTFIDDDSVALANSTARQGKYILATGGFNQNIDLVYVVNIDTQKLVVYAPNLAKRTIDKMGTAVSLKQGSTIRK